MKNNFIAGLITGLCGALFIITVLGSIYVLSQGYVTKEDLRRRRIEAQDLNDGSRNGQLGDNEGETPSYDDIVKKLSYLEMLVEKYFLDEVDGKAFADGIFKGFVGSLRDPYSTYYTQKEYQLLMESSSGVYFGIGATVSQEVNTGIVRIVRPFETGPAFRAGILPGDIIYKVDHEEVTGMDLSEVVSRMKGPEGTSVDISIVREGENEPLEFTIIRREIHVPTIEHKMLENEIGLVVVSGFDEITVEQFENAIDDLLNQGMKGLIVDLRNNPGGLLDSVVKMLDRIIPKGLVVYTEDKHGRRFEQFAKSKEELKLPLAVLINGQSASASEIFAGVVQDYEVGTVIGTTSFGKGIVQKVIPLPDGTAVKLTISKYFTPNGRSIHGTGITPDIEVELDEALRREVNIPVDQDNQLQEAIRVIRQKLR